MMAAGVSGSNINHLNNHTISTIEDQMRSVDKLTKECDVSRKALEQLTRRLDELYDEIRRYREFLGQEKSRRDPALYKTNNVDRPSMYNESICVTMSQLTQQLTQEWTEKLRNIHNQVQQNVIQQQQQQQSSTPVSRSSDRIS